MTSTTRSTRLLLLGFAVTVLNLTGLALIALLGAG